MNAKPMKANIIKASYRLMQKVGMGPIPPELVAECEQFIRDNNIDFMPWAMSCTEDLSKVLGESVASGTALDAPLREGLIAPIMQLKASGTMFDNEPLTMLAGSLLHFLESIPRLDKDVLDIVRANEAVLSAFLKDGQSGVMTPMKLQLINELRAASNRYATKNNLPLLF